MGQPWRQRKNLPNPTKNADRAGRPRWKSRRSGTPCTRQFFRIHIDVTSVPFAANRLFGLPGGSISKNLEPPALLPGVKVAEKNITARRQCPHTLRIHFHWEVRIRSAN